MEITCHYRNDLYRELTDPVLEATCRAFVFRLYSGDICDPQNGNWFKEPFPTRVWRTFVHWPILPFFAWRWPLIGKAGYLGFKLYGVDAPEYRNWLPAESVYEGSQAVCLTIRPFATIEKER